MLGLKASDECVDVAYRAQVAGFVFRALDLERLFQSYDQSNAVEAVEVLDHVCFGGNHTASSSNSSTMALFTRTLSSVSSISFNARRRLVF